MSADSHLICHVNILEDIKNQDPVYFIVFIPCGFNLNKTNDEVKKLLLAKIMIGKN